MFKYIKLASLVYMLSLSEMAFSQTNAAQSPDAGDIITLGTLSISENEDGERTIYLNDETRGKVELILTPTLIEAIEESPADSFEVEGTLSRDDMVVKSLRPIE